MALSWPPGFAPMMGWVPAGPVLLRLDVAERVAAELGYLTRRAAAPLPPEILGRFGIKGDALAPVLAELGFRLIPSEPLPEGEEGPVLPTMVAWARPAQPPRQQRHQRPQRAATGDAPAEGQAAQPPRRDGPRRDRPNRSGPPRGERPAQAPVEGQPTTPQGADAPRPEGQRNNGPRPEGGFRKDGPRRDGPPRNGPPRGDAPRGDGPRREGPRRDGPPRDRDRGPGGPETRTFHEDRPSSKAEDSPFAALMKLKLK